MSGEWGMRGLGRIKKRRLYLTLPLMIKCDMCILCSKLKVVFLNTFELSESQESKNILFPKFAIRNKKLVRIYKKKLLRKP